MCLSQASNNRFHQSLNPFPHTTILQETALNIFCQKMKNLYNWIDNLWLKVENIVSNGEIARLSNFFFCHYVFKKVSAAEASESIYMRERVKGSRTIFQTAYWTDIFGSCIHNYEVQSNIFWHTRLFPIPLISMNYKIILLNDHIYFNFILPIFGALNLWYMQETILLIGIIPFPLADPFWCIFSRQLLKTLWWEISFVTIFSTYSIRILSFKQIVHFFV